VQQVISEEPKAPAPQAAPQPAQPVSNVEQIVREAARKYGVDENHLVHIARCESSMNPNAVNYGYNENGYPSGLYQHLSGYWPARAAKYGYAGASVFDPVANANVTAGMFRDGASNLWECR
jgi:soluble lytic murein transglycosylase-like protein